MNVKKDKARIIVMESLACQALDSGTLTLQVKNIPVEIHMVLKRVFIVPAFNKKIISISRLITDGFEVTFKDTQCILKIPRGGGMSIVHSGSDGLYHRQA